MSDAFTRAKTDTFSEARLRTVMLEVSADFYNLVPPKLASAATVNGWVEELTFILQRKGIKRFQIQIHLPDQSMRALDYRVSSDGTISASDTAGGIDYFGFPEGTRAGLYVELNHDSPHIEDVRSYTKSKNWGTNGHEVEGTATRDRAYSKDGYGVVRSKVGNW